MSLLSENVRQALSLPNDPVISNEISYSKSNHIK